MGAVLSCSNSLPFCFSQNFCQGASKISNEGTLGYSVGLGQTIVTFSGVNFSGLEGSICFYLITDSGEKSEGVGEACTN